MNRKDYRVTVKVRNNNILSAAEAAGYSSMPKLAEAIGWSYQSLNDLVNMTLSPFDRNGKVRGHVDRLCALLNVAFDDLFSLQQCEALAANRKTVEVDAEQMFALINQPVDPMLLGSDDGMADVVADVMDRLTKRESEVLRRRYGFDGVPETYEQIGLAFDVTRERIRQIEHRALRKLRHPSNTDALRQFSETMPPRWRDTPHNKSMAEEVAELQRTDRIAAALRANRFPHMKAAFDAAKMELKKP